MLFFIVLRLFVTLNDLAVVIPRGAVGWSAECDCGIT